MDIFKCPIASFSGASKPTELGTKPGPCKTVDRFMLPSPWLPPMLSFPIWVPLPSAPHILMLSLKLPQHNVTKWKTPLNEDGARGYTHTHFLILTKVLHLTLRKLSYSPSNHSKGTKNDIRIQVELIPFLPTFPAPLLAIAPRISIILPINFSLPPMFHSFSAEN